jgi:biotin operon repressor
VKHIEVRKIGYLIEVSFKGYRLVEIPDCLSPDEIRKH